MKKTVQIFIFSVSLLCSLFVAKSHAQSRATNGWVGPEFQFLKLGQSIVHYLHLDPRGQALVQKHKLDLKRIEQLLEKKSVLVVTAPGGGGSVPIELVESEWRDLGLQPAADYRRVMEKVATSLGLADAQEIGASFENLHLERQVQSEIDVAQNYPALAVALPLGIEQDINYGGTGCTNDGFAPIVTVDNLRGLIHLDFSQFYVWNLGRKVDYKACSVAIPLQSPHHRVILEGIDVYALADLSENTSAKASAEIFFAGLAGDKAKIELNTKAGESQWGRTVGRLATQIESQCGQSVIVRAHVASSVVVADVANQSAVLLDRVTMRMRLEPCP